MGFGDKLKGLKDQAQQAVADNKDKIQGAVQVVGDAANTKTQGKYATKIAKVGEKVESSVDKFAESPGSVRRPKLQPRAPKLRRRRRTLKLRRKPRTLKLRPKRRTPPSTSKVTPRRRNAPTHRSSTSRRTRSRRPRPTRPGQAFRRRQSSSRTGRADLWLLTRSRRV